jgi:hypothetical protein
MRTKLFTCAVTVTLVGCASSPVTHPELPGVTANAFVCSQRSAPDVKIRLQKAWSKCYLKHSSGKTAVMVGGAPVMVPLGSSTTQVIAEGPEDGGSVSVRSVGEIRLTARIYSSASCPTLLAVNNGPALWVAAAKNTRAWIEDPDSRGPFLICD